MMDGDLYLYLYVDVGQEEARDSWGAEDLPAPVPSAAEGRRNRRGFQYEDDW